MSKIAIVYWSGTGNTEAMADLVGQGVRTKGSDADLINAADFGPERLDEYVTHTPSAARQWVTKNSKIPSFYRCTTPSSRCSKANGLLCSGHTGLK